MDSYELHPAYALWYNCISEFFDGDPTITVGPFGKKSCTIYTTDQKKAEYLKRYLYCPENVNLNIVCEPKKDDRSAEEAIAYLLKDSFYYSDFIESYGNPPYSAILLTPEVIAVNTDDAFSPSGCTAYTPQRVAKILFHGSRVNFQTNFD